MDKILSHMTSKLGFLILPQNFNQKYFLFFWHTFWACIHISSHHDRRSKKFEMFDQIWNQFQKSVFMSTLPKGFNHKWRHRRRRGQGKQYIRCHSNNIWHIFWDFSDIPRPPRVTFNVFISPVFMSMQWTVQWKIEKVSFKAYSCCPTRLLKSRTIKTVF